jgi:hypothetical protein
VEEEQNEIDTLNVPGAVVHVSFSTLSHNLAARQDGNPARLVAFAAQTPARTPGVATRVRAGWICVDSPNLRKHCDNAGTRLALLA